MLESEGNFDKLNEKFGDPFLQIWGFKNMKIRDPVLDNFPT